LAAIDNITSEEIITTEAHSPSLRSQASYRVDDMFLAVWSGIELAQFGWSVTVGSQTCGLDGVVFYFPMGGGMTISV
jgi:hypothetical protein